MRSTVWPHEKFLVRGRRPSLPAGLRVYAIGDIHGRLDLLNQLLALIDADMEQFPATRPVYVFLGDYIDRGHWSRETIERLIEHAAEHESVFLKGNHELIAISCLSDGTKIDQWLRLGGMETLSSYGVGADLVANRKQAAGTQLAFHNALPQSHVRLFSKLAGMVCERGFFLRPCRSET